MLVEFNVHQDILQAEKDDSQTVHWLPMSTNLANRNCVQPIIHKLTYLHCQKRIVAITTQLTIPDLRDLTSSLTCFGLTLSEILFFAALITTLVILQRTSLPT